MMTLLERLATLSSAALESAADGDLDELERIVDERQRLIDGAAARLPGESAGTGNAAALAAIESAAARLGETETMLGIALKTERDRVARELDAIEVGEPARSAYGVRPENPRIDLLR